MAINNYDYIAGSYDLISRLIFQKSIINSQKTLATFVTSPAEILIVGGGTGAILEEITKIHPTGLNIIYVDISSKMIGLAKKRDFKQNQVEFLHMAVENYISNQKYDFIITAFVFDNFSEFKCELIFRRLNDLLHSNVSWLFADFKVQQDWNRVWQKPLLKCMYWFFWIVCRIEAVDLPDMDSNFGNANYTAVYHRQHFFRFIQSFVYRRAQPII
ncbi:class I SAM-dependent methyltransferase [Dyadobacter psychrotolerans]|uniref:Class I SAM-dependent methyltransferase n=1 Tax=Dyadobacter psychrotolerans TaxID=2541721 RepID=A0A4R5DU66_9BACT|nr:class I SAM-dependent methyltransferase [Dyadobacter psychrotolerans]TDE18032.1 class I SAM-dependent methyltransferase [Dyadobacter psychrotolerans]